MPCRSRSPFHCEDRKIYSAITSRSQSMFCGEAPVCRDGMAMPASLKILSAWARKIFAAMKFGRGSST